MTIAAAFRLLVINTRQVRRYMGDLSTSSNVLEFAERTFYAAKARPPSARALADADHKLVIEVEWKANYSCYGASIAQASATPVGRFRNRPDCAG